MRLGQENYEFRAGLKYIHTFTIHTHYILLYTNNVKTFYVNWLAWFIRVGSICHFRCCISSVMWFEMWWEVLQRPPWTELLYLGHSQALSNSVPRSTSILSRHVHGIFSQPPLSTLCFSLRPNLHQSESKKRQTQFYNSPERPKGNCEKAQGRGLLFGRRGGGRS